MESLEWVPAFLQKDDLVIAVDGGLNHLEKLGVVPDLLIGDLDSVSAAQVERVEKAGAEVLRFPPTKDETDLELALLTAHNRGCDEIVILAGFGGRLDQTLGNLSLLRLPELEGCSVRFEEDCQEAFLIRNSAIIRGQAGDTVSLLPLWGVVTGVTTTGLAYPLRAETLYPEHTRGISNVMNTTQAGVSIASGRLLCIHMRNPEMEKK